MLLILQAKAILPYWIAGLILGGLVSTFGSIRIEKLALKMSDGRHGTLKVFATSMLGIISPVTMHGMVPFLVMLGKNGVPQYLISSFVISSILLNPNLFIFSMTLGVKVALLRLFLCLLAGTFGGLLVKYIINKRELFNYDLYEVNKSENKNGGPGLKKFLDGLRRAALKTGRNLLIGIVLTALFDKFFPRSIFSSIFINNKGLGVLFAASIGVPLYFCGGGTIPLIGAWMQEGMSLGSAAAFMITGPATKFNNLTALKNIMGSKSFLMYILFNIVFGICAGLFIDLLAGILY